MVNIPGFNQPVTSRGILQFSLAPPLPAPKPCPTTPAGSQSQQKQKQIHHCTVQCPTWNLVYMQTVCFLLCQLYLFGQLTSRKRLCVHVVVTCRETMVRESGFQFSHIQ